MTRWETRRAKYGPQGHNSSYARSSVPCTHCRGAIDTIIRLHIEAVLSEGQAAKALNMDRVEVRRRADAASRRIPAPVGGSSK